MATWQDGPEYAPLERPDEFDVPEVAPLEQAPPPAQPAPAPVDRPVFSEPAAPVAPLAALVPVPADLRDPHRPFDVVSSNLTSGGAWGEVHGSAPHPSAPYPVTAGPVTPGPATPLPFGPTPSAAPAPYGFPASPSATPTPAAGWPPTDGVDSSRAGFPAPGTPEWFGPGRYGEQPAPNPVDARQVLQATTPGLLIVLGIGAVFSLLAPVMVVVAFLLCRQVKVAQSQVRRTFAIALGSLGAFALIGLLSNPLGVGEWWGVLSAWSRLVCLLTAFIAVAQVWGRLKSRPAPPPPPASDYHGPWG